MTFPSSGLDIYAPSFTVKLKEKNEKIPDEDIIHVEIDESLEDPGMFTILLNDLLDMKKQKFRWLDDKSLESGALVEISFSYASSTDKKALSFLGRIKSITSQFNFDGNATLEVRGYDLSHDLMKSYKGKYVYNDQKYSQAVENLASVNKLETSKIEQTKTVYENISRKLNEDDYNFIKRLAENIGFEFFVREKHLYFRKSKDENDGEITFENGKNIISFSPTESTSIIVNEAQINSCDIDKKEKITQTAKLTDIKKGVYIPKLKNKNEKKIVLENINVSSAEDAKTFAIAELKRKNKHLIVGRLESIGNPALRSGMTVKIEKVGKRFIGSYYVEKATHSMGKEGYRTVLKLRRCK